MLKKLRDPITFHPLLKHFEHSFSNNFLTNQHKKQFGADVNSFVSRYVFQASYPDFSVFPMLLKATIIVVSQIEVEILAKEMVPLGSVRVWSGSWEC
jgi:hypothetical protein